MVDRLKLEYVRGGAVTYPPGATFGPRKLSDYEMVWIVEGQGVYHVDGKDLPAPPGAMILARPGFTDAFTWDPRRPTRHAYFHFDFSRAPSDWPPTDSWPIVRVMNEDDVIRPLFRYVLRHCDGFTQRSVGQPTPMLGRAVETLLGAFISGQLSQASEHDRDYPEPVARAVEFMRRKLSTDPSAPLTLAMLARAASVSAEHLCRLFRATFNAGPMEALRLMRLDLAVTLLARSNLNVEQVAQRTGFPNPFHFSRRFKRVYGLPPTRMRQRIAAGTAPPVTPLARHMKPLNIQSEVTR